MKNKYHNGTAVLFLLLANSLVTGQGPQVVAPAKLPDSSPVQSSKEETAPTTPPEVAFGYDVFQSNSGAINAGPVDDQYLLSAGDEVVISIWGELNETLNLAVSDQGFLELPERAGRIQTNGVTLRELRPLVVRSLSQIYAAYINAIEPEKSTAFVDIRLGKIRPLLVYVVGEVSKPGAFAISATVANVINLLNNAGGVRTSGTLREIKIRRNDGTVDVVDLYGFFLNGDVDYKKIRLQPGDYVIVPIKQKSVTVLGEVRRPSTYELIGNEGIKELISFAGGATPDAYLKQSQLKRSEINKGEVFLDLDLSQVQSDPKVNIPMSDRDVLTIGKNVQVRKNIVSVRGDGITRAGTYEWTPGMRLADVIAKGEGLREYAYLDRADLIRTDMDFTKRLTTFSLAGLYAKDPKGTYRFKLKPDDALNFPLREMDEIFVQSAWGLVGNDQTVTLEGHIKQAGPTVLPQGMTLYDLLFTRGGFQDPGFAKQTFMDMGHIFRRSNSDLGTKIISFDLGRLLARDAAVNMTLEDGDIVRLYSNDELAMKRTVTIQGVVKSPGLYPMAENMTVEDLVILAGGLQGNVTRAEAVVARTTRSAKSEGGGSDAHEQLVPITLDRTFASRASADRTRLNPFDRVMVRYELGWEPREAASALGEVVYPGGYSLSRQGQRLSGLVKLAGGLTTEAFPEGAVLLRTSTDTGDLVDSAKGSRRAMVIDLAAALRTPGGPEDILMMDSDELRIPKNAGTIEVLGALQRPMLLQHRKDRKLSEYLALCGGLLERADRSRITITSPNKSALTVTKDQDLTLLPGSVIMVPFQRDTERLQIVEIKGAVSKPAMVQHIDGAQLGYYIGVCGGFATNADLDKVVVLLPDGRILAKEKDTAFNPEVPSGSVVVVTAKPSSAVEPK